MSDHFLWLLFGAVLLAVLIFISLVAKNGVAWGIAKLKTWWTSGEARLQAIEADIAALKFTIGTAAAAGAPAKGATGATGTTGATGA